MNIESLLLPADFLQSSTILIYFSAYFAQWLTLFREKSSQNISLSSWNLYLLGSVFALFYAVVNHLIFGNCLALLCTTVFLLVCNVFTIYLILKFREQEVPAMELILPDTAVRSFVEQHEIDYGIAEEQREALAL